MIKRLAKLKQYGDKKDMEGFLKNEFRQNNLAIESAFRDVNDNLGLVYSPFAALSVENFNLSTLVLTPTLDNQNLVANNTYTAYSDGTYDVKINFLALLINGIKTITLRVFVNGNYTSYILHDTSSTAQTYLNQTIQFYLTLKAQDSVYFALVNQSSANSNVCTCDGGLLIIQKLRL